MKRTENYVYTERAHFMCPNMHFGILVRIKSYYDGEQVKKSLKVLQKAHPFLQSLIAEEKDTQRLYYQIQDCLDIPVIEKEDSGLWQRDYNDISNQGWNVRKECMLKVLVYPKKNELQILFICHHLLCDGRGLLQLAEEFSGHYAKKTVPPFAEEQLIQSIHDLPANSDLPFISKLVINDVNRKWENNINKVIIAADVRNRIGCYRQGAMGNYSTAFSILIKKKENDMISLAKQISKKVFDITKQPKKEFLVLACYLYMRPDLIDAVAISSLGAFESKAGAFVGKNMFGYGSQDGYSITNLGKIQNDIIAEAAFIPPASPANRKTWGVLTVNNCMKICRTLSL